MVALGLVGLVGAAIFVWSWSSLAPDTEVADRPAVAYDLARSTITLLGVLTIGGGAAVAYRRQIHLETQGERDKDLAVLEHAKERRAERSDLHARYQQAAAMLANSEPMIRVAAVYALEALAVEWTTVEPALTQRGVCIDLLCGYLRSATGLTPATDGGPMSMGRVEMEVRDTITTVIARHLSTPEDRSCPGDWSDHDYNFAGARLNNVVFVGARFTGSSTFENVTILGDARFDGATFAHDVSYAGSSFTGRASFSTATFTGSASFSKATFTGDASFGETTFTRSANFAQATFARSTWFREASFARDARFVETIFAHDVLFREVAFEGEAWFNLATFKEVTCFDQARFADNASFGKVSFARSVSFAEATFTGHASFDAATFAHICTLDDATFEGNASFIETTFGRNPSAVRTVFKGKPQLRGAESPGNDLFAEATIEARSDVVE